MAALSFWITPLSSFRVFALRTARMNCFTGMWLRGQLCEILVLDSLQGRKETQKKRTKRTGAHGGRDWRLEIAIAVEGLGECSGDR